MDAVRNRRGGNPTGRGEAPGTGALHRGWDSGIQPPSAALTGTEGLGGRRASRDQSRDTATPASSPVPPEIPTFSVLNTARCFHPRHLGPRRLPAQPLCLQRWPRVSGSSGPPPRPAPLQGPGATRRAGTSQHRVNLEPERLNVRRSDADLSTDAGSASGKGDVPREGCRLPLQPRPCPVHFRNKNDLRTQTTAMGENTEKKSVSKTEGWTSDRFRTGQGLEGTVIGEKPVHSPRGIPPRVTEQGQRQACR